MAKKCFQTRFGSFFRIPFRIFSNRFSYRFKSFSGAVSFCRHAAVMFSQALLHVSLLANADDAPWTHESQPFGVTQITALSRPIPDYQQGEVGRKTGPLFLKVFVLTS